MNVKYFIFLLLLLSTSIRKKKVILTLGSKGKRHMTGCALILVSICESDLYDILHEVFKEGNIPVSPGCHKEMIFYFIVVNVREVRGVSYLGVPR